MCVRQHAHPFLILPRDSAEASVQLQMFSSSQIIKQGVELRAVTDALLHAQKLPQDAAGDGKLANYISMRRAVDITHISEFYNKTR